MSELQTIGPGKEQIFALHYDLIKIIHQEEKPQSFAKMQYVHSTFQLWNQRRNILENKKKISCLLFHWE